MSGVLGSWRATYTPGAWLVLCGPTTAVVLEPADASWSDLVETLWTEVLAAGSIGDLAARLATYRIDTMPSFAAFFWGPDGMRSLVRGAVRVVDADTEQVVADGDGVQTWTEVGLPELARVRVDLPTDHDSSAYPLPLVVGVVGASSLLLDAAEESRVSSPQGGPGDEADEPAADESADEVAPQAALEDAATALLSAPPALPPAFDPELSHEDAGTRLIALPEGFAEPHDWADDAPTLDEAVPGDATTEGLEPGSLEATTPGLAPADEVLSGPTVDAVVCAWGHPNPPGATSCRICSGAIAAQRSRRVTPPVLAVLRASNGETVEVSRPVLVGRAPSPDRSPTPDPQLLTLTSPSHDISRTHLVITPADWEVSVTDLHSTNGTLLIAPDGSVRQLDPGEPALVALGTTVELAEGVSVLVDFPQ